MTKRCGGPCGLEKPVDEFHPRTGGVGDGYLSFCKKCQRQANARSQAARFKDRQKRLVNTWHNIKGRCEGRVKTNRHIYEGLPYLDKAEFIEWALADPEYHRVFDEWERAGYPHRLTPSVNRIDSSDGYLIGNIEWVPFHENVSQALHERHGTTK